MIKFNHIKGNLELQEWCCTTLPLFRDITDWYLYLHFWEAGAQQSLWEAASGTILYSPKAFLERKLQETDDADNTQTAREASQTPF